MLLKLITYTVRRAVSETWSFCRVKNCKYSITTSNAYMYLHTDKFSRTTRITKKMIYNQRVLRRCLWHQSQLFIIYVWSTLISKCHRYRLINVSRYTQIATVLLLRYEEMYPPEMADFIDISAYSFSRQDLIEAEITMLHILRFNVSLPLPIQFLRRYSKANMVNDTNYHIIVSSL